MTPLQRSATMPATLLQSEKKMKGISMHENDIYAEEEEEEEEEEKLRFHRKKRADEAGIETTPIRTPPNQTTPPEIRGMAWDYFFMDNLPRGNLDEVEEEEVEEGEGRNGNVELNFDNMGGNTNNIDNNNNVEFMTPEKKQVGFDDGVDEEFKTPVGPVAGDKHFLHSNTAPSAMNRMGIIGGNVVRNNDNNNGVDLLKILSDIDDHFLKASQSSQEVSKMLEATRLHYHSNFADNRGHIDHAARVMQVITWNKSFRGVPNGDGMKDNLEADDYETHATVLDKLLAWEKKLYEEVKAAELMKIEYQRKVSVLNKLKKRNASSEQLEKAKAAVSHLHTRYIVDMQSLDSTVSEVNDIRDKQLFPKLVALVNGMSKMWESMHAHHDSQLEIVSHLKSLDVSGFLIETTKHHHERTKQIATVVDQWHTQFEKLVSNQKQYINSLNSWLKLNLIPIESSLREKAASSPPRTPTPPIQPLLRTWHDRLEKLPDDVARSAIASFGAVIKTIIIHQEEEMNLKEKYEDTRKEYVRRKMAFEEWYQKYMERRGAPPPDEAGPTTKDPIAERQFVVESLKKRMEEEMEDHQKHCMQVREKSLGNLKIRLPELFRALKDYAYDCFGAYESLRMLIQQQNQNRGL